MVIVTLSFVVVVVVVWGDVGWEVFLVVAVGSVTTSIIVGGRSELVLSLVAVGGDFGLLAGVVVSNGT